jgi:hypothetical protein
MRIVDDVAGAVGWLDDSDRLRRTSHALGDRGRVWLVDVVDDPQLEEWIAELGRPVAVLQLLDRHNRDCATVAERLGVPLHVVPERLPGTPFELRPIGRSRWWREVALWWPERRLLVCADAVGTVPDYFCAGAEPAGLHPFLRLRPPRSLRGLEPEHLLVGHGAGVHHEPAALENALRTARRRIPRLLVGLPRLARAR